MTEFVSGVKTIPHNEERIFNMLSDLTNIERIKDYIPQGKVKDFAFDRDSLSFVVDPVGEVAAQIVDREPYTTIKFMTTHSPLPMYLWIQLKRVDENDTRMKITLQVDLSPFLKPIISKQMQEAVERLAVALTTLPY
jgi:hypothetical protein